MLKHALTIVLLGTVTLIGGCGQNRADLSAAPMRETIIPICTGDHAVSIDTSGPVAQVKSECRSAAHPN